MILKCNQASMGFRDLSGKALYVFILLITKEGIIIESVMDN